MALPNPKEVTEMLDGKIEDLFTPSQVTRAVLRAYAESEEVCGHRFRQQRMICGATKGAHERLAGDQHHPFVPARLIMEDTDE
jgi:uncharacterized protein YigA (DUF484 family)